jgi:hypothetical protein
MKDKVTLTLKQLCTLANACTARQPELVALCGGKAFAVSIHFTGDKGTATLTLTRTQAKKMQACILDAAQGEAMGHADYITINDAFRNAYDETLRRKCGEA